MREDLLHYGVQHTTLYFDWSASCLEGTTATWLEGIVENFSNIALLDQQGRTVVEGWMEFILADGRLLVYWDNLNSRDVFGKHLHKSQFGIPLHIWNSLPAHLQILHQKDKMKDVPGPIGNQHQTGPGS